MTPTSPLAGLLTGLLDGTIIAVAVFLVVLISNRRHRTAQVRVHPVAADLPRSEHVLTPNGNLHRAA
jgi:large-conductance mechanosensitive channel